MSERLNNVSPPRHIPILRLEHGLRRWLGRLRQDERGQTSTEFLMIIGLMAAIIVITFTIVFWPTVKSAAVGLTEKIANAIGGGGIS